MSRLCFDLAVKRKYISENPARAVEHLNELRERATKQMGSWQASPALAAGTALTRNSISNLAQDIAGEIQLKLTSQQRANLSARSVNPEAYEL
jgi:hypothetical protein